MHRSRPLFSLLLVLVLAAPLSAAPPKSPPEPIAVPNQLEAPTGTQTSPTKAGKPTPGLVPGVRASEIEQPTKIGPEILEPPSLRRPAEAVGRPQSAHPPMLPHGVGDPTSPPGGPQIQTPGALRELVAADVRIVEIARAGRKVAITGRADRAIPPGECCDLVLSEGPLGTRILWRGRATVVRIGSGYGFVAMADHMIPGGRRQQLIAQLVGEDRIPSNNRLMKWVGSEGGAEFTESDRPRAATAGSARVRGGEYEVRSIRIRRSGPDWAELEVAVWMARRSSYRLRLAVEGIPAASCVNGRGESEFLASAYNSTEEFNETFTVVCRSPSQDASGRIRASLIDGRNTRLSDRSVAWTVRATEATIDRRAARGDAQLREIAGTDAAPADLAVSLSFAPLDGRPHFLPVSVVNRGASPSPSVVLRIRFGVLEGSFLSDRHLYRTVPELEPGESWRERIVIGPLLGLLWEEIRAGEATSFVEATVDSAGVLYEANEANNRVIVETQSSGMHWRLRFDR